MNRRFFRVPNHRLNQDRLRRFDGFESARCVGECGFIPFVVAGDPDFSTTSVLLAELSRLKPVAIEVGVPFSDPTADGAIIQRAAQRALLGNTTLAKIFQILRRARPNELATIVLFSYYHPILQFGLAQFARAAAEHGVAGVLVVDLPAEAAALLHAQLRQKNIDLIFLFAPTKLFSRFFGNVVGNHFVSPRVSSGARKNNSNTMSSFVRFCCFTRHDPTSCRAINR